MTNEQFAEIENFIKFEMLLLHNSKFQKLNKLTLHDILSRKNLYLFKTKNLTTPEEIVRSIIDAFISSSEETTFGNFLEKLAIKVSEIVGGGRKSSAKGIDLEIDKNSIRFLVAIKSGPNWGNSGQIERMLQNFRTARKILQTGNAAINTRFVNGCCYGLDDNPDKSEYIKLCGQRFWSFISEEENFYLRMIEPLGYEAKERSEQFYELFMQKLILFAGTFHEMFVENGVINWNKLIMRNSGIGKNKEERM